MKHTPGPWAIGNDCIIGGDGETVVYELNSNEDDARLIAAAPDLLECLKAAMQIIGHPDDSFSQLAASVIAKAEGK